MVRRGAEIYQYHAGTDLAHNTGWAKDRTLEQLQNCGRIYRTVQRLDGFVSADFAQGGGEIITPLMEFSGDELHLNVKATGGSGRVEILDESGAPIRGFNLADCREIRADSVNERVSWRAGSDLSRLRGRKIHLRFRMRGVKLYAFQFAAGRP
jgi:hypothetical protein